MKTNSDSSGPQRPRPGDETSGPESGESLSAHPFSNALAERIKELNCLYGISNLLENQDVSLSWVLERAVELIPAALQYPEQACALIRLDNEEFTSKNFAWTKWSDHTPIMLGEEQVGTLEVFYKQPPPSGERSPFLKEEATLLRSIGERLSRALGLKRSEESLKESEERYRILTEQVSDGIALVQNGRFYYVNPAFCTLFALKTPAVVIGRPVPTLTGSSSEAIMRLYQQCLEGDIKERVEQVHCFMHPAGTLWIQACHNPISFQGQPAVLSTFNDVTEIKEQQIAAERLADRLHGEYHALRLSLKERYRFGSILGRSAVMQEVYELILKAALTNASVALLGESGSGKELVAQAIHEHSPRKDKPFVAVNCGAVQESLFEREFFGHCKGAFTGAHSEAAGYLDLAHQGTLFLDEVGELTVTMQAKLLRAIEGSGYRPIGGMETVKSDFRLISASNVPLNEKVESGQMRSDFFYRLQVLQIHLPPLRERREDIPLLVDHFVRTMQPTPINAKIPGHIMDILQEYEWPGNVRELKNVLQRYLTMGKLEFLTPHPANAQAAPLAQLNLPKAVQQLEASLIAQALARTNGNRTRAAALLGISRRALFRKDDAAGVPESPASGKNARN